MTRTYINLYIDTFRANPAFRALSDTVQKLFFVILCERDEESRFLADATVLLEAGWRRESEVSVADVEAGLETLRGVLGSDREPLVFLWEDDGLRLGFLPGWFEHQTDCGGEESSLPRPPWEGVASWAEARAVKREYCEATGKKSEQGAYMRNALRWAKAEHSAKKPNKAKSAKKASVPPKSNPVPAAEDMEAVRDALLDSFPPDLQLECETYLGNAAEENESKKLTVGRQITLLRELAEVREMVGDENFRYGLQAANAKGAVNKNYVKQAAIGNSKRVLGPGPGKGSLGRLPMGQHEEEGVIVR